jgi:prepilin-type N-terminal cleavage/methylation domain-containing protein
MRSDLHDRRRRLIGRLREERGYTMVELLVVMLILVTVVTSLTTLFVSGAKAQLDLNRRFEAQQAARLAADRMRREVHCANAVTITSASDITVILPGHCPTAVGGATTNVAYTTEVVSANRYRLKRNATTIADYLTVGDVFSYVAPSPDTLGKLALDLRVNINPNEGWKQWRLKTEVVLRNTTRT